MLSIELLRNDPDHVRRSLKNRGDLGDIDEILDLDSKRRKMIQNGDDLRSHRNSVSKNIGASGNKDPELIQEMRKIGDQIKHLEQKTRDVGTRLNDLLLALPNLPINTVPIGENEHSNTIVRTSGIITKSDFKQLPHWDIGEQLKIIDFKRGVKLSGSRFFVLKNKGARLQRALIDWMLDLHSEKHGYQEVYLPNMVTRSSVIANSNLPKFADTMYQDTEDDLWLIPTAETALTNLHRDEILDPNTLPLHYTAHTPCFRREKAAAGKDTRGIKRVHQFEKVEMYKFVEPQHAEAELKKLISDAEDVCQQLEIPYRVIELCTGDLGFQSAKSFDIDMWAPGCSEWLEVSSCSTCTDFQARRANIRYRPEEGAAPTFVHTLNGSGLALPRVIIAIIENFQQEDGSVLIPNVLRPYTNFDVIEAR